MDTCCDAVPGVVARISAVTEFVETAHPVETGGQSLFRDKNNKSWFLCGDWIIYLARKGGARSA